MSQHTPGHSPGQTDEWSARPDLGATGTPGRAGRLGVASLVTALVALVLLLPVITAPLSVALAGAAIVLGVVGRRRVKHGKADSGGLALAGLSVGAVALLLGLVIVTLAGLGLALYGDDVDAYADCVAQAGGDQARVEQCDAEFEQDLSRPR